MRRVLDRNVVELLHYLRREGNQAAHEFETTSLQAKSALKIARELALWFYRALGKGDNKAIKIVPFVEPTRPDHEHRFAQLSSALESEASRILCSASFVIVEQDNNINF